jgi:hypothetical protein
MTDETRDAEGQRPSWLESATEAMDLHARCERLESDLRAAQARIAELDGENARLRAALESAHRDFHELRQTSDLADCIGFAMARIDAALSTPAPDPAARIRQDGYRAGMERAAEYLTGRAQWHELHSSDPRIAYEFRVEADALRAEAGKEQ